MTDPTTTLEPRPHTPPAGLTASQEAALIRDGYACAHRIKFLRRDGEEDGMVSPQASAIVAFGDADADALLRSDLPGVALDLRAKTA